MSSGSYKLYLLLIVLALFVAVPFVKSALQESSIGTDLRRAGTEYSLRGPEAFRKRVDQILVRAPLDPAEVEVRIEEQRPQARVLIEIRYVSRMKILFYPVERQVVVREEIPLVPL